MTEITIGMERGPKCSCAPGVCEKASDPESCVFRRDGDVRVFQCDVCGGKTWHQDGVCIACTLRLRDLRDSSAVEQAPVKRQVEGSNPSPAAIFDVVVQVARGKKFTVTDRKQVAAIMKILLEPPNEIR